MGVVTLDTKVSLANKYIREITFRSDSKLVCKSCVIKFDIAHFVVAFRRKSKFDFISWLIGSVSKIVSICVFYISCTVACVSEGDNAFLRRRCRVCFRCIVGSGHSRVMQWRASVSEALLLLLGVLGDSATTSTESLSISEGLFFKFMAGTHTARFFLRSLAIPFISNEW